jgi:hypothetical protein
MSHIQQVGGRVVEAVRFVNANKPGAPRLEFPERRELWLQAVQGGESKFVIHTRALPARRGHWVVLLVHDEVVVGLFNLSTGSVVNYLREDPVALLRLKDFLVALAVTIGGMLAAGPRGLMAGPVCWGVLWVVRLSRRLILQRRVDSALEDLPQPSRGRTAQ